jgi:hypothetical protein
MENGQTLEVGDLVLQVEKDIAPGHWQLAIVKESHPSADGFVCIITIKTKTGKYKDRSLNLLCGVQLF